MVACHAINTALETLDVRVIDIAEQTIIDILEKFSSEHNKVFVRQAIRSAIQDLLASILEDETGICVAFEAAIALVVETSTLAMIVAKVIVSDPAIPSPIGTYVAKMANKTYIHAFKLEVGAVPPSPTSSGSHISSSKSRKVRWKPSGYTWSMTRHRRKS